MAQSSEIKLNKRFDQNIEVTGTITTGSIVNIAENTQPTMTFIHSGSNPGTNDLIGQIIFQADYEGSPQTWAGIYVDTNASSVRTDMDFLVKSTSGNLETGLKIQGGSSTPKAFFYNDVDIEGNLRAEGDTTITGKIVLGSAVDSSYLTGNSRMSVNGYIMVKGIVNTSETGTGPAAIVFGDGNTLGSDQISLVTSGGKRLYINSAGVVTIYQDLNVNGDVSGANLNISNWDTAYGWGNHASQNYADATDVNEAIAQSLGWVPAYSNTNTSSIRWNETEQAVEIQSNSDTTTGAAYKAIRMKSGDRVRITVMVRSTVTTTDGLYLRLYFHNGDMPDGKTHVSNSASSSTTWVQEDDSAQSPAWWENNAVTTSWQNFEYTYTAPADGYLSLVILNWSGIGTNPLYVKNPDIQFEKVSEATTADTASSAGNADTLDGLHASSFLTSLPSHSHNYIEKVSTVNSNYDFNDLYANDQLRFHSTYASNGNWTTATVTNYPSTPTASSAYAYGATLSLKNNGAGMYQVYAPHNHNSTSEMFFRTGWNADYKPWARVWTDRNHGSGKGLDADLVDGFHASSFLRSDANDSTSGQITVNGGRVTIVEDSGNRPALAFQETPGADSFILEYNGVGSGAANYVAFYSTVSGWTSLGSGLNYIPANGSVGIGTTTTTGGDYTSTVPKLHVKGADTSGSYHTVARFQAGNDANDTGAAIIINHSNDRGLAIRAGRKDSDRPVAYFDLIDSNGSATNMFTLGEYGTDFRAGINTTSPDTTFHVNGGAKIGGSFSGTELLIEASDTAGAPASTATIKMIGYEGRGIGTFYKDVTYGSPEWFAGIRYSGSFQNYQIGYTATGGQAEYAANAIMTVNHTGQVGIGTHVPASGYKLDVAGLGKFDNAVSVNAVDTGNVTPASNEARLSGYGIIGNRGTFYVTNAGGTVQIGNGSNHNNNPTAYFTSSSISLLRPTSVGGNLTASGSIKAQSTSYIDVSADQTDSAMVKIGVSSGSIEGFVMTDNTGANHIDGNAVIKMLVYSTGGALVEPARFTTDGIVANGSDPAQNAEITCYGNMSFGNPGNGTNVNGRFISIEGNTDGSGEGSGRLFFTEHNSTTTSMDAYGMSIGYRGGGTTITGASGNAWTGLSQIGNGQWGMWGHDNNATGALIMYGDRAGTFVNFAGNNIQGVDQIVLANAIVHDNDTDTYLQFNANDSFRVVIAGSEVSRWGANYLRMNDGDTFRMGTGSDFRQWHNGTDHYFRNYHHAGGNIYFQTEGTGGVNHALIYMYGNTDRPYVVLYEDSVERLRTVSDGVDVTGIMTATADVVAYSDERVKENVKTIDNALDKVKALRGVSYNRTDLEDKSPKIGVIAQEVQKVLPEVVYEQSNEMLAVSYGNMVSVLIEAIKELSNKVEELENKLNGTEL